MAPPKKTPVQLSGGAGFDFEDAIAARFLLLMLRGEAVFGTEQGTSMQLDFQAGESGWLLDDLEQRLAGKVIAPPNSLQYARCVKSTPVGHRRARRSPFVGRLNLRSLCRQSRGFRAGSRFSEHLA
jgi:hypothetical protein